MKKRTFFCCTLALLLAFAALTACSPAKPPADNAQTEATVSKDAEEIGRIVTAFSEAYFSGDTETIKSYLTESASSDIEVYSGEEEIVLSPLPDFSDIPEQEIGDAQTVSLPYKPSPEADSLQYLTMELVKLTDGWKVRFYGIEG